jgi:hypothetical protein
LKPPIVWLSFVPLLLATLCFTFIVIFFYFDLFMCVVFIVTTQPLFFISVGVVRCCSAVAPQKYICFYLSVCLSLHRHFIHTL